MHIVIDRWRLKLGDETLLREGWRQMTESIWQEAPAGSFNSWLVRGGRGMISP
jgi:hypothetical protein